MNPLQLGSPSQSWQSWELSFPTSAIWESGKVFPAGEKTDITRIQCHRPQAGAVPSAPTHRARLQVTLSLAREQLSIDLRTMESSNWSSWMWPMLVAMGIARGTRVWNYQRCSQYRNIVAFLSLHCLVFHLFCRPCFQISCSASACFTSAWWTSCHHGWDLKGDMAKRPVFGETPPAPLHVQCFVMCVGNCCWFMLYS